MLLAAGRAFLWRCVQARACGARRQLAGWLSPRQRKYAQGRAGAAVRGWVVQER